MPPPRRTLLLLPALSAPLDRASVRSAYKPTLDVLLPTLKPPTGSREVSRLDIAIAVSEKSQSRSVLFSPLQLLLERLYTLVCTVAAEKNIELDFPGGLDVRIVLLQLDSSPQPSKSSAKHHCSGPLFDLPTFISGITPSTTLYAIESESGIALSSSFASQYRSQHRTTPSITQIPCGPSLVNKTSSSDDVCNSPQPHHIHKQVANGGTFDHLHIGHKLLLTATALLPSPTPSSTSRIITVGTTGDDLLVNKKHASVLESWDIRQQRTAEFVESILIAHPDPASIRRIEHQDKPGPNGKVVRYIYSPPDPEVESEVVINYTMINDPFGPTITEEDITAIVVSKETRGGGKAVNDKRADKGWKALEVFEVDILDAKPEEEDVEKVEKESFEEKISSTEIRKRLVELEKREGKL